jgi:hypothetical protein
MKSTFNLFLLDPVASWDFGHTLDLYVILLAAGGGTSGHRYWVQPFGDGRTGFLQPVRLAV